MPDLIYMGGNVKALGNGKVAGYLVTFSDETAPDLSAERDFFTAECDYDLDTGNKKSVFYAHGLDAKMGVKRIGVGEVKRDDVGVWIEAQLNIRDSYEEAIYKMAEDGKLGWSSGAPSHLVTRKAIVTDSGTVHEILSWPLAEASLTPCPADHRNAAIAFKSLPALIGIHPAAEDHTVKTLPSGMSYSDLLAFLSDELNEDFPDTDDDGTDPWGPGLYVRDVYDDNLIYADEEDLYRIPYTVTAGNDVQWGTPESVVRTTVYVTATDGDDDAGDAGTPTVPGALRAGSGSMAGKGVSAPMSPQGERRIGQADVTALKEQLTRSMPFGDHADIATSAMEGFVTRAAALSAMSTKAGRVISGANRDKLRQIHAGMTTAHTAMAGHLEAINALLLSTDPDAKKDMDEIAALRMRHERIKAGHRDVAI